MAFILAFALLAAGEIWAGVTYAEPIRHFFGVSTTKVIYVEYPVRR